MNKLNKQYFKTKATYKEDLKWVKQKKHLRRTVLNVILFLGFCLIFYYIQKLSHERIQENIKNDKSIQVDNDIAP